MRPINLIPERERRAHGGGGRTGPLAYIVVGALGVLLIGVVMLVLFSNTISDREDEVASLESEKAAIAAEVSALAPYVSFETVARERTQTVTQLADSRFDWVRVVRQLSLILPPEIYLINLTATGGGGGAEGEGTSLGGPSMAIDGCAPGQDAVAGFIAALKQIDGVTRVGLSSSSLGGTEGEGGGSGGGGCKRGTATFNLVVVFDEAPVGSEGAGLEGLVEGAAPEGEAEETVEGSNAAATVEGGE